MISPRRPMLRRGFGVAALCGAFAVPTWAQDAPPLEPPSLSNPAPERNPVTLEPLPSATAPASPSTFPAAPADTPASSAIAPGVEPWKPAVAPVLETASRAGSALPDYNAPAEPDNRPVRP